MAFTPADRLTAARVKAGYARRQDAIDALGWKKAQYTHHETGERAFDIDTAKRYGRAYGVDPAWLVGLKAEPGDPVDTAPIPDQAALRAIVLALLEQRAPGRAWSDDLIEDLVSGLRGTLATLAVDEDAARDPEAARRVARSIAVTLGLRDDQA